MRQLFDRIQDDWKLEFTKKEFEILENYAEDGRKLTKFYASMKIELFKKIVPDIFYIFLAYMYSTMLVYFCMPTLPKILDVLVPLNASRPELYLFEAEYFIDQHKYYFPILIHAYITCAVAVSILVAFDTEYVVQVLHGCGIFAVLRSKKFLTFNKQLNKHTIINYK